MPYISQIQRARLDPAIDALIDKLKRGGAYAAGELEDGELNYIVSRIVDAQIGSMPNYDTLGRAVMTLEMAKLELYRRVAAPHEDKKLDANGDVYASH